jgi:hypothetical protein
MATRRGKPGVHRAGRDGQLLVDATGAIESADLERSTDRTPVFIASAAALDPVCGEPEKGLGEDSVVAPRVQMFFFPLFDPQGPPAFREPANVLVGSLRQSSKLKTQAMSRALQFGRYAVATLFLLMPSPS